MDKDIIVQFVGFVTHIEPEVFITAWEPFIKQAADNSGSVLLQEAVTAKAGNKFKYILQHESRSADFRFAFAKEKDKTQLPEQKIRVVQSGGYAPVQIQTSHKEIKNHIKVLAFLPHGQTDMDFYKRQTYRHLNIYEAYFESCKYSYVMEFYIHEMEAPVLIKELKGTGVEVALCKETLIFHSAKKHSGSLM